MYGLINKSIEELVKEKFSEEIWLQILEKSNIEHDFFISSEAYDDSVTYKLVGAISELTGLSVSDILLTFGEWWVLRTSKEKYGSLMEAGGTNLKEFLVNLPVFHNRVMLIYPKLTPPEFKVSHVEEKSIYIHYFSKREGLQDFVKGLLLGLGKMYETPVDVELLESRDAGQSNEIFKVSW